MNNKNYKTSVYPKKIIICLLIPFLAFSLKKPNKYSLNLRKISKELNKTEYYIKSNVYRIAGDIKINRINQELISKVQLAQIQDKMQTGDIVFIRRNWYITNYIFNGFWPHAAIYFKSIKDLRNIFPDDYIFQKTGFKNISEYLKNKFPVKFEKISKKEEGLIFESTSEGVGFNPFLKGAWADYVCCVRPNITIDEKLSIIKKCFKYYGKEYDYNFDYFDNSSLVCTEVVWKCFQNTSAERVFEFTEEWGKVVIKANSIAKRVLENIKNKSDLFQFVYYLEGDENSKKAFLTDITKFEKSVKTGPCIIP